MRERFRVSSEASLSAYAGKHCEVGRIHCVEVHMLVESGVAKFRHAKKS
jgi:hypothetical protein